MLLVYVYLFIYLFIYLLDFFNLFCIFALENEEFVGEGER